MEKKIYELKTNEKLATIFPPLDTTEYQMLEDSIIKEGCTDPLIVWDGTIVDGHNRYRICREHEIPFAIEEKSFDNENDALMWMLTRQLGRRNLTSYHKGELALRFEPLFREKAKETQGTRNDLNPNFVPNSAQSSKNLKTRDHLSQIANVGHDTMTRIKKLSTCADEGTKEQLRKGKVSVNKAYTDLIKKEHEGEKKVCARCGKEKPVSEFPILSNKQSFEPVCITCEKEQKQEAHDLSDDEMPIGVSGKGGFIFHTGNALPDVPESFEVIKQQLQIAGENFMASLALALQNYTSGMVSEENDRYIETMISAMAKEARQLINEHKKEVYSNE